MGIGTEVSEPPGDDWPGAGTSVTGLGGRQREKVEDLLPG